MHKEWIRTAVVAMGLGAASLAASAQADVVKSISLTDVSLSLYGAFAGTTSGDGVQQSPSNAAGLMVGVRHIDNPLVGYEGTYSWNRANQVYSSQVTCGIPCGSTESIPVSANAHELAGDWIVSFKLANLRPFGLAGVGMVFNEPASGQADTHSSDKGVFLYGVGLDWGVLPHLGLRFQYRGNVYHAPDLTNALGSSDAFVHTGEPMIGGYFRF
jgi:opacity protein-like surface antigen